MFPSLFAIKNLFFLESFSSLKFSLWSSIGTSDYFLPVILLGYLFVIRITRCLEWQLTVQRFPPCPCHLHSLPALEIFWHWWVTAARPSPPGTTALCLSATESRIQYQGWEHLVDQPPSNFSASWQSEGITLFVFHDGRFSSASHYD